MSRHSNRAAISNRLAKRVNQIDPVRDKLLGKILEVSSSISLNDAASQSSARQALEDHSELLELIDDLKHVESTSNPELPSRCEQSWSNFLKWVDSELGIKEDVKLSERVDIRMKDASGYSSQVSNDDEYALIARTPLKKGQQIFGIHRRLMLSTETVAKDLDLCEFVKKDSIASAMQNVVLVLHLLNEYSKKEKSYWQPYLAILPNKTLPILSSNKSKLTYLLPSSHLFEALKMIRAISRQYSYFFKRLQGTSLPLSRDFTYEYYCWGVSIVCSRQNEIPPSDRKASLLPVVHALIPVLDMCNHDRLSNQAIFEEDESRLLAAKDLNVDNEITINYGCRSSGDFFIHNGFVPDEVPFDIVPLNIALDKQDPLYDSKVKLLKTLNMPTSGRFRLTRNNYENRHKRDPHLTMFLIVYFLNSEELEILTKSDNPIGIADETYEYVQYSDCASTNVPHDGVEKIESIDLHKQTKPEILAMKERLRKNVKMYLSRRASIGAALIDRVLADGKSLDASTERLLMNESWRVPVIGPRSRNSSQQLILPHNSIFRDQLDTKDGQNCVSCLVRVSPALGY